MHPRSFACPARARRACVGALALALLPLLAGCGARSSLADEPGGAAPASACPAAVEAGAPSPMLGDCSTRTFRSAASAPASPHVAWSVPIGTMQFIPTVAVDANGSAYVAMESPADPSVLEMQRVDPPGTVAWSITVDGSEAGTPIVGADGKVRLVHLTDLSQPELLVVDPATGTVAKVALPNDSDTVSPLDSLDPAVGTDGSLYLSLSEGPGESGRVARVSPAGTLAWRSAVYTEVAAGLALGPGDRPYVLTWPVTFPETGVLLALDPDTGATRWSHTLPGQPTGGPAVRSDGRVEVLTGGEDGTAVLWVLSPEDGSTVWSMSPGVPTGIWLGLAADDSVVFISGGPTGSNTTTVTAVDAGGAVRWHRTLDGQLFYTGALDASGLLLLASSDSLALDVETGETQWSLPPPSPSCVWPLTVSTGGVAYGVECDGTFFAASD